VTSPYQVAAYYFPQYHPDPRNDRWHGDGWTEWELVKRAEPRFPGHQQPKEPLWGYQDESDPAVMAQKIDAAADHGITTFIYDWYWYEGKPFLNGALDHGFLGASNNDRLTFALMWANHDWVDIHPAKRPVSPPILATGAASRSSFEEATDCIIRTYFLHASYWRLDGCPYFSIYDLTSLIKGLGGVDETRVALDRFRIKTKAAGFTDVHLNAIIYSLPILPGEQSVRDPNALLSRLGFDSVTSYVWMHHVPMETFPTVPYAAYARHAVEDWNRFARQYDLPYIPNVTMGWDASPRTVQSDAYDNLGYPFMPILIDNTPDEFEGALARAKDFLDSQLTDRPILTINAWNEWTEGSYLEPDVMRGLGYLEAVRRVFGGRNWPPIPMREGVSG